jgi:hypothetical protein
MLDLSKIFNLFNLPSGRRLVALREVLPVAREFQFDKLVDHLEKTIVREKELLDLERKWRAASAEPAKGKRADMTYEEMCELRIRAQNSLLSAVALVFTQYEDEDDPESMEARAALLSPIMDQHDVVHAYLRSGLKVRDIDPDTGEITDEVDLEQPEHIDIDPPPAQA